MTRSSCLHLTNTPGGGRTLLAEALKASEQVAEFKALLQSELTQTLGALHKSIAALDENDETTWARPDDPDLLCDVFV